MEEIQELIIYWADQKGILFPENANRQLIKLQEELGEVAGAFLKGDSENLKLEIGDMLVVVTIFAEQNKLNLTECLQSAYNKIKNRTGKTINGTFIKD